jgi:opacity protein-like surface antigen
VSFATGYRAPGSGWEGADDHWVIGIVDGDWRPPGWPVWIAGTMLFSYSSHAPDGAPDFIDESGTYELSLGLRRYTVIGEVEPWIGGGVALLGGSVSSFESGDGWYWGAYEDDAAWGWYLDAGVQVPLSQVITLGLAVRYTEGSDLELYGEDLESGGTSVLLLVGTRF